mmetsp:Transcript_21527/g.61877  ORF Transcript_21527/g.61877 Transcript_21527/m.61877 type:complete len:223 (-) Transcript_21527:9-677(-)
MACDTLPLVLRGCAHGDHRHAELGHVVRGEPPVGLEIGPDRRAHADHTTEAVLRHDGQAQRGKGEGAASVQLHDQVVLIHRRVLYPLPPQGARVVYKNVNSPELLHGEANALLDVLELPHVHPNGQSLNAEGLDLLGHGVDRARKRRLGLRRFRRHDHVAALLGQGEGALPADTAGGAGDDGDPALEVGDLQLRAQSPGARHLRRLRSNCLRTPRDGKSSGD